MKEIMTPHEAAEYLKLNVRTIYRLVKNGSLPGHKVGRGWRFKRDVLDKWLSMRETQSFKD
jgi:excisionase family DNA binding protein